MTINKKGGKHKHKKRQRNNTSEMRKNPKNIHEAKVSEGTYYAKVVSKGLGNRRFKIRVPDRSEQEYISQVRGSRHMKYQCPRATEGCWVIAAHSEYDDKMTIDWVFKDWEVIYLKKKKKIRDKDDDKIKNDNFEVSFEHNKEEKVVKIRNSEGIDVYNDIYTSDDEEGDDFKIAPLNHSTGKTKYTKPKPKEKEFDFDSI